jgi:hypothetical protein
MPVLGFFSEDESYRSASRLSEYTLDFHSDDDEEKSLSAKSKNFQKVRKAALQQFFF